MSNVRQHDVQRETSIESYIPNSELLQLAMEVPNVRHAEFNVCSFDIGDLANRFPFSCAGGQIINQALDVWGVQRHDDGAER